MEQTQKPHLSISQLNMLSRCGEQYYQRYIQGRKVPPGISLIVGKAVDNSVTKNLTQKLEGMDLFPIEAVADFTAQAFNKEWDSAEISLTDEEVKLGLQVVKGDALDKSVRLARLHAVDLAPAIEPTHLQRKMEVELPNYPYNLLGYLDIVEKNAIRDTKTTGKTPPANIAEKDDQLTIYAMMAKVIDGVIPENLFLDYLIDNKIPVSRVFGTKRDESDFQPILRRLEVAIKALEAGVFVPARETDWWCDPRWCGYHASCKYVKQQRRPTNGN